MSGQANPNLNPDDGVTAAVFTACFLVFAAILDLPYGFYTLLRLVVTGAALYLAAINKVADNRGRALFFLLIGLLFNPLIPVTLDRPTWRVIDLLTAVAFFLLAGQEPIDSEKSVKGANGIKHPPDSSAAPSPRPSREMAPEEFADARVLERFRRVADMASEAMEVLEDDPTHGRLVFQDLFVRFPDCGIIPFRSAEGHELLGDWGRAKRDYGVAAELFQRKSWRRQALDGVARTERRLLVKSFDDSTHKHMCVQCRDWWWCQNESCADLAGGTCDDCRYDVLPPAGTRLAYHAEWRKAICEVIDDWEAIAEEPEVDSTFDDMEDEIEVNSLDGDWWEESELDLADGDWAEAEELDFSR